MARKNKPGDESLYSVSELFKKLGEEGCERSHLRELRENSNLRKSFIEWLQNGGTYEIHRTKKRAAQRIEGYYFGPQEWAKYFRVLPAKACFQEQLPFDPRECPSGMKDFEAFLFFCPHSSNLNYDNFWNNESWARPSEISVQGIEKGEKLRLSSGKSKPIIEILREEFNECIRDDITPMWKCLGLNVGTVSKDKKLATVLQNLEKTYQHYNIEMASALEIIVATTIFCQYKEKLPPFFDSKTGGVVLCKDMRRIYDQEKKESYQVRAQVDCSIIEKKNLPDGIELEVNFTDANTIDGEKTVVPSLKLEE